MEMKLLIPLLKQHFISLIRKLKEFHLRRLKNQNKIPRLRLMALVW